MSCIVEGRIVYSEFSIIFNREKGGIIYLVREKRATNQEKVVSDSWFLENPFWPFTFLPEVFLGEWLCSRGERERPRQIVILDENYFSNEISH